MMKKLEKWIINVMSFLITLLIVAGIFVLVAWPFGLFDGCSRKSEAVNKAMEDTISVSSYKKAQLYEFSGLIKDLKNNLDFFRKIEVDLARGFDPISMEKPPATIDQLSKWASYDFIVLSFPDGFINEGALVICCDNYDKKNPEFFAKIHTIKETSYGFSERSIPYHMAKGEPEEISENGRQRYFLQAIHDAREKMGGTK
jgi:hypothetical protein